MAWIHYKDSSGSEIAIAFDATLSERHSSTALISEHPVEFGTDISDNMRPENDRLSLEIVISNTPIRTGPLYTPSRTDPQIKSKPGDLDGATGTFQAANLFESVQAGPAAARRQPGGPTLIVEGSPPLGIRDIVPGVNLLPNLAGAGGPAGAAFAIGTSVTVVDGVKPVWQEKDFEPQGDRDEAKVRTLQFAKEFDRVTLVYEALLKLKDDRIAFTVVTSLRTYKTMGLESMDIDRTAVIGNALQGIIELRQFRVVKSETIEVTEPTETRGEKRRRLGNRPTKEPNEAEKEAVDKTARSVLGDLVLLAGEAGLL